MAKPVHSTSLNYILETKSIDLRWTVQSMWGPGLADWCIKGFIFGVMADMT